VTTGSWVRRTRVGQLGNSEWGAGQAEEPEPAVAAAAAARCSAAAGAGRFLKAACLNRPKHFQDDFATHDYGLARVVERAVAGINSDGLRDMLHGSLAPRYAAGPDRHHDGTGTGHGRGNNVRCRQRPDRYACARTNSAASPNLETRTVGDGR